MTVNIHNKRRRIDDEEEEKQNLQNLSISQSVITINNKQKKKKKKKKNKRRRISAKEKGTYTQQYLSNMFPHDIMLDILSRLPVKPLMRFKSVSKSWNYLIRKDQFFINMHLSHSKLLQREKMIFSEFDCNYGIYSLDYSQESNPNRLERLIHHNSRLRHIHRYQNYIWGSCNGLICTGGTFELDLFISNPSTREYRKIPYFNGHVDYSCYGFGYNPNDNDYVVVEIICCQTFKNPFLSTVAIYSLRKNSWKKIQDIPYAIGNDKRYRPGELLNGSLHWVTQSKFIKNPEGLNGCDNTILAFDITTEKFVEVPCPDDHHGIMIVGQYQGKLCFYQDKINKNGCFALWVMNEYKVRESWSKVFNIRKPRDFSYVCITVCVLCSTKEGYIVMHSNMFENGHLLLYDPKQKTRRHIPYIRVWGAVNYYVPSIVAFDFN